NPDWTESPRRRFSIARWRVELADLILRQRCAKDIDELELLGKRKPIGPDLRPRLEAAIREYRDADRGLNDFNPALVREEDLLLAQGIGPEVEPAAEHVGLNLAWALVYEAMTGGPSGDRAAQLAEALRRFDAVGRRTSSTDDRFSAIIGAGIAFRESGRV